MQIAGQFKQSTIITPSVPPPGTLRAMLDNESRAPEHVTRVADQNATINGMPKEWAALPHYVNGRP